ncbi:ComF family protein [Kineobactrum salinum]|uniref:ComF family protein n=1 Tax=Kineobactrum salinum TaxID=2708301 RepID=A0A6C0U4D9_9GAMM|nr:double zinc ribbon domain-containing protein [Kineobactrum salinum]QIB65857.1 ComF family protein [Kineobactrum salinum]
MVDSGFFNACLEGLFPQYCLLCKLRSHQPLPLCDHCRTALQCNSHCCHRCALPLAPGAGQRVCGQCLQHPPALDRAIAPLIYEPNIAWLIQRWKFHREQRLAALFAQLWLDRVSPPADRDLLLPVPLHWRRLLWRGFNQATALGQALQDRNATLATTPLRGDRLARHRYTPAQARLGARARDHNLDAAFGVRFDASGLRIALIDDVMTTGATANTLAAALKRAGAEEVQLWCVARTPAPAG